jgi:serine protease Do
MLKTIGIITAISLTSMPVAAQIWTPQAPPAQPSQAAPPRPASGWVGITYSGSGETDSEGNLVYGDYPVVVTVDPGSPAARAGIVAGDTIIAFNDRDLRRFAFPIRAMIQPGKPFIVRARRAKKDIDFKLIVAERPADHREMVELTMKPMLPGSAPEPPFVLTPGPMRAAGTRVALIGRPIQPIAGAELRALSVDLAKSLGIKPKGLFVVYVVEGTPAREAGLRDGDVLLRASEQALQTTEDLREVMRSEIDRSVKLEILRQKKTQVITLRW